jgi:tRNA pseudouridine32 synthase/23S rRNA pseudouridine746 synthase
MRTVAGVVNSRSLIHLLKMNGSRGYFHLKPVTGKTHQLRLHMSGLGFRIINDRLYPDLLPEQDDDFGQPLQLLAKQIAFRDPVSGKTVEFSSEQALLL